MRSYSSLAAIFACVMLIGSVQSEAETLGKDYEASVLRQKELVKERRDYEVKLRRLSAKRHSLNLALNQCFSKNFNKVWESRIKDAMEIRDKLEDERNALVKLRVDLDDIRSKLESSRMKIELKYRNKSRGDEYETEFRQYMSELEINYFLRLENGLFAGYETYLTGVGKYHNFLQGLVDECMGINTKGNQ